MSDLTLNVRVFMDTDLYKRLSEFAEYHSLSLSKACRIILDSAPLELPVEVEDEDAKCS